MILESQFYDGVDNSWSEIESGGLPPEPELLKTSQPVSLAQPVVLSQPVAVATVVEEPLVETILGNGLTNSQKWAWVIGLTFAAWALIYWNEKKMK